jgi:23S rRNA (uracil1939-C5)-methyltransferase
MKGRIEHVIISDIAEGGKGVGRVEGRVIFVDDTVPGDVVHVDIKRKKNRYIEAKVSEFLKYSEHRVLPKCQHFSECGGCRWQHLDYNQQLFFKSKQVREALVRIAGIADPVMEAIIPSKHTFHYRNRLDFAFSEKEWLTKEKLSNPDYRIQPALGFHVSGRFDKVLNIDHCLLQDDFSNRIRNFVRQFALQHHYTFFNRITQQGMLRNMIVRNTANGQWMVAVMFKDADDEHRQHLLHALAAEFPEIVSLYYVINPKKNDTFFDLDFVLYKGEPSITQNMEDLKFLIGPKTFFQTNTDQALALYQTALQYAEIKQSDTVYDLYTGTGTIAAFAARQCKQVIGVEFIEESVIQARVNAQLNKQSNTRFFAGDMQHMLNADFFISNGHPDVIITDPPRAGMHPDVVKSITNSGASRVVYVSCNPSTMARDIALMSKDYDFVKAKPVDMFPHTDHVECVALLHKKT